MTRRQDISDAELDQALAQWAGALHRHEPPPGLAHRILENLPAEPADAPPKWLEWLRASLWRPALAAALPIIVGFAVGAGTPAPVDPELAEEMTLLAFSDVFEEIDDVQ